MHATKLTKTHCSCLDACFEGAQTTSGVYWLGAADVCLESFSTDPSNSAYELMSASTPIATRPARRCNM